MDVWQEGHPACTNSTNNPFRFFIERFSWGRTYNRVISRIVGQLTTTKSSGDIDSPGDSSSCLPILNSEHKAFKNKFTCLRFKKNSYMILKLLLYLCLLIACHHSAHTESDADIVCPSDTLSLVRCCLSNQWCKQDEILKTKTTGSKGRHLADVTFNSFESLVSFTSNCCSRVCWFDYWYIMIMVVMMMMMMMMMFSHESTTSVLFYSFRRIQ